MVHNAITKKVIRVIRILLVSHKFSPDYGGIETISLSLAEGFKSRGLDVEVLTHTQKRGDVDAQMHITRGPGAIQLIKSTARADVVFHNNICLRFLWPALFLRKPIVFAVHNWLRREDERIGYRERIKRYIIGGYRSITVSKVVQASLPFKSTLVYNSYNADAFYSIGSEVRIRHSVAFVGRLVEGKGCPVLIQALALLKDRGLSFTCSIIGDGPERGRIEEEIQALGLQGVTFHGALTASEIGDVLRRTEILAVPSHYRESFGLVALEGVACGCFVVTSDHGGLPEAVGACGESVPQNDVASLADAISNAWDKQVWRSSAFRSAQSAHLEKFSGDAMIEGYREVLEEAVLSKRKVVFGPPST